MFRARGAVAAAFLFLCLSPVAVQAQEPAPQPSGQISADERPSDDAIAARIAEIYGELESLSGVTVEVHSGVVRLTGVTESVEDAARAAELAGRVAGVVTVENRIERDVSLEGRVNPAVEELRAASREAVRIAPVAAIALGVFAGFAALGWTLARFGPWKHITPNLFVADLVGTTVRVIMIGFGAVAALSLLDATAILGAILGAAGVIGLAVGFAVRDTIENYIASIMLSVRQPFRPNDHVVIGEHEGRVLRLTSRATVLMTLDGNHLRIPNSTVFKAVILNYTTNPERRFEFDVGVDADDDPIAAIRLGEETLSAQPFILRAPEPSGFIVTIGDSNIVLRFMAWIDQRNADFMKSRTASIAAVKTALEDGGFALPEPIYRLRIDERSAPLPTGDEAAGRKRTPKAPPPVAADVAPDDAIVEKVESERREQAESDLLDEKAPTE